ncbi:MAG: phosphocholine cytidylyltransferase family protein [Spirochaetota bacterium]
MIERAIILAAGLGSRLKPMTDHAPKCLTEVNGTPILLQILHNLHTNGINECTIVTGYLSDIIRTTIGSRYENVKLEYVHNDIYMKTNNIYSLWLARKVLEDGSLLIESDVFFRSNTLKNAFNTMGDKSFYIAGRYDGRENEILIKTDRELKIKSIDILHNRSGKKENFHYMSSGLLVIQKDYGRLFSSWLDDFIDKGKVDVLFDAALSENVSISPLHVFPIDHSEWVEIDTIADLARAEKVFRII